ncbi:MAG: hypothetical protein LBK61_12270, partial [Spirochaetaceae bacterium]|nr:hypothetical protein [Spirochaetaceae bacterium]
TALAGKQDALESGKSIKTVDGKPLLGSGNIETSAVAPVSVAVSDLVAANSDYAATGNVYKIGKLVVLNLTVKAAAASKSLSANTAYDLFTFKSGYSPNINGLNFAISLRNSNTVAAMAYTNMDSTGTFVRFKAAAAITLNDQTDIRLSAVYVAAS